MEAKENKFSQQLLSLRNMHNISQDKLAEQLFISRQTISKWETGETVPDLNNLIKLSNIFNVSLEYLVFETDNNKDKINYVYDPKKENMYLWQIFFGNGYLIIG